MALAQGSGELIWWPYIIAKYGLTFLFLLLPACLLQYPLTYSIGYYTLVTGKSIFQGFIRLNRFFTLFLWILMSLSFLWVGAFASAGGTALAALTDFSHGWGQSLFWAYLSIAIFVTIILFSKVIYTLIERFLMFVAVLNGKNTSLWTWDRTARIKDNKYSLMGNSHFETELKEGMEP